jgi:tRNA(Met) C34 N-acetyltransferase TmcA
MWRETPCSASTSEPFGRAPFVWDSVVSFDRSSALNFNPANDQPTNPTVTPTAPPTPRASETFLQQAVSLLVASHYKNTPNDLLLLADAPAHQLYVLLAPVDESQVTNLLCGGRLRLVVEAETFCGGFPPLSSRPRPKPTIQPSQPTNQTNQPTNQTNQPQNALPDVLAVVQVALEGAISAKAATSSLARGELPQGDLIPWTVGQQYQVGGD